MGSPDFVKRLAHFGGASSRERGVKRNPECFRAVRTLEICLSYCKHGESRKVRNTDEYYIQHEELCINDVDFCLKNEELCTY